MYLEHFGLHESPFRITPHTDFFFDGANRGPILQALLYAVLQDEGIVKVSGEVGSGKTMLCRMLMERLPATVETVYIANPTLSRDEILFALADELRISLATERVGALMKALQEYLIERHGAGRQVVVLVDEAHAMPAESLEQIRLLSNLETRRHKLLQLVLFGQPELDEMLRRPELRPLKDRITHNFRLAPLVRSDVEAYLQFRMRAAGYRGPNVFGPAAVRLIAQASGGLTRRVNILADKCLLATFAANTHLVTAEHARAAIRDADFEGRGGLPRWLWPAMAAGVLAAALVGWPLLRVMAPEPAPAAPTATAAVALPSALPEAAPAAITPVRAAVPAAPAGFGPLAQERIALGRQWLAAAPDEHWFIQLGSAGQEQAAALEDYFRRALTLVDPALLRAYAPGGASQVGIVYGSYASAAEAQAALRTLPPAVQGKDAYARQVRVLK